MKTDLLCIGMALVDSIIRGFDPSPVSASGYRAASGSLHVGGEAVNEAMAAAKLGLRAGILCSLGRDAAGDMVVSALGKCGVDTSGVIREEGRQTPVTTMFVHGDGSRKSITNEAHRFVFHPENYRDLIAGSRAVVLGSLFRAPFDDPAVILETVRAAREAGALVLADTKLPNFRRLTLDDLRDVLPYVDYIFPNEDEARYYGTGVGSPFHSRESGDASFDSSRESGDASSDSSPDALADVFLAYGVKNVVIKLGDKGCLFKNPHERFRIPALPVNVVDATGAGDNFIAGFASVILAGGSHEDALRFGNACGAICCTAAGASAGLASAGQVRELLANAAARRE